MYLNLDKTLQNKSLEIIDKYVIVSQTDAKGIITNVSEAFCEISGYSKEELIGKSHNIIRHRDMPKSLYRDMWDILKKGDVWQGTIKNRAKDGKHYWVYTTIEPNFDNDNNISSYIAIRQDITVHKELEAQHSIIVQQSKSAAMGEMVSMIAHQWRQPLQAVSLLAQKIPIVKMLENEITDEFIDKTVSEVMHQLNYMSDTIDDFRNFFKPDKEKEDVEVTRLINQTLEFLKYMIKVDSIEVKQEIIDDLVLSTYSNEVVQVLINLVKNSRDALVDHGVENRRVSIKTYKEDNYCIIQIQDNGGGIDIDVLEKVFEPYFSTKENKNGTGLGLYMAKTIIENHCRGFIKAQNSDGGALFIIGLPI